MAIHRPKQTEDVAEILKSQTGCFDVVGSGSRRAEGRPVELDHTLDLSGLTRVIAYEPEELILEVEAGAKLDQVEKLLKERRQMLAFEPSSGGTMGGILNRNHSGSRRLSAGAARDHILGVHCVDGRGVAFKGGGRVVKNVTGYDMSKLVAGSYGTLAVVTALVFKVLPLPETESTVLVPATDVAHAVRIMSRAMGSPLSVSCAAYVPHMGVGLRIEGIESSVKVRVTRLVELLGDCEALSEIPSQAFWYAMRERKHVQHPILWRISLPPSDAPGFISAVSGAADISIVLDWAGGLIWLGLDDANLDVRSFLINGHAMLFHAPDEMRLRLPVFNPQPPSLTALSARVKYAFDPQRRLNPGRMYESL